MVYTQLISATIPFCKQLGLILSSLSKAQEGGGGYILLLHQKGLQMVVVFSYKFLFSFPVEVQCQEWLKEQCMQQKDTKGEGGERREYWKKPYGQQIPQQGHFQKVREGKLAQVISFLKGCVKLLKTKQRLCFSFSFPISFLANSQPVSGSCVRVHDLNIPFFFSGYYYVLL